MRAMRRLTIPSAGDTTSVRPRRQTSSRLCASICAFSASAALRPSWAATSCACAVRAACSRVSYALSAMWPASRRGFARSNALRLSTRRASACTMLLRAWAIDTASRASAASFCATWASRVSETSRASTSPFFTRMPSSASTSMMRSPSTSGPTRISSRATSEPVASTVSTKSAGAARTTVTAAASIRDSLGGGCWALLGAGPKGRGKGLPTSVSEIIRKARASTAPIRSFRMFDPSRGWRLGRRGRGRSHRVEQRADQLQHGRHHGRGIECRVDGPAPEHAVGDHHEGLDRRGDVERGGDAALRLQPAEQLLEALGDVAVEAVMDLADAGIARRLQADLDAHAVAGGGLLEEILLAQGPQGLHEVRGGRQLVEALGELGPVALGDAGDQRLLAVEVDVERAGADAGLLADVMHGRAMEAGAPETLFRRVEDVLPARTLDVGLELGHASASLPAPPGRPWAPPGGRHTAAHKTKRTAVLFAGKTA